MEEREPPNTASSAEKTTTTTATSTTTPVHEPSTNLSDNGPTADYYIDSNCSTPYVSAPSSPGRPTGGGFFYSAPASPMHYVLSNTSRSSAFLTSVPSDASSTGTSGSFEFEFSARFANPVDSVSPEVGAMSSADELFHNGQIRPMKLSSHLETPQVLGPLLDVDESEQNSCLRGDDDKGDGAGPGGGMFIRGRDLRLRDKSLRRRTRSLSPLRNTASFGWSELARRDDEELGEVKKILSAKMDEIKEEGDTVPSIETTPSASASSSRCSSAGRSSKRWVFLKDFLRSKSEGRNNVKFWTNISFAPAKERRGSSSVLPPQSASHFSNQQSSVCDTESKDKGSSTGVSAASREPSQQKFKKTGKVSGKKKSPAGKPTNGIGKRRVPLSAHEMHYTTNRAQAEEMRKKTFLPYRQGLLGCLGFSSKSYGAMNGFARALNPVSSR